MISDFSYDLLIIGGGISACVFASKYLQNNISKKIALIEVGRRLGGRSSTRISKKFKGWKLNHGAPNFNINNRKDNLLLRNYIDEIVRSFEEISKKKFNLIFDEYTDKINIGKSTEIIYGLRNFIGNANKFSKKKVDISLSNKKNCTFVKISDDGNGFPKDLINSEKLGEPYIRTLNNANSSKQGLGLGTFIGKTLLEKNFAIVKFQNSEVTGGAEVIIKWKNKDLKQI